MRDGPTRILAADARGVEQTEEGDLFSVFGEAPRHLVRDRGAKAGAHHRIRALAAARIASRRGRARHGLDRLERLPRAVEAHRLERVEPLLGTQRAGEFGESEHVAADAATANTGAPWRSGVIATRLTHPSSGVDERRFPRACAPLAFGRAARAEALVRTPRRAARYSRAPSSELPPISKKSSSIPTLPTPSTSDQIRHRSRSVSSRGATCSFAVSALSCAGAGRRARSTLPAGSAESDPGRRTRTESCTREGSSSANSRSARPMGASRPRQQIGNERVSPADLRALRRPRSPRRRAAQGQTRFRRARS